MLGLALPAGTEATLGGLTVTDVGEAAPPAPDARPVQRPDHLAAFARLFGALRFFYPAQAGGDEWHALAIAGVAAAERARDPAELAHVLEVWAQAIGPAIHIYPGRAAAPDPTFGPLTPGWHHFGVAGESAAFQSAFVGADDDHPAGAVERDLGLGLAVRFPRAFPGQNVAHRLARPPARDACAVRDDPRGERLATMLTVWSVMEHFHPHLDVLPIHWSAALPPALDDAARVTDPDALVHAIQRLLAPLQDAGAWVDHEARLRSPLPLSWRCLGDDLVIDAVSAGERRLRPGDIVETIDGVPAIDLLRATEAESSAATPAARRWQAATRLRVDAAGPTTALGLRDPTGARRSVTLEHTRPVDLFRRSYPPIRRVDGDVAVVELHRLDDDARARLPRDLADARGVVFDLRAHVGGSWRFLGHLVDDARPIAGWQKMETVLPGRAATRLHTTAGATLPAIAPRLRVPVAFLADARTGPEGERMLALVAAFELGAIVGETTMGAHCRDNGVWIPDGTFVRWTACRDLAPDGTPAVAGVAPTIPVQPTAADLAAGRDPVLDAAVAHLRAAAR